jgi:hypothetical protein
MEVQNKQPNTTETPAAQGITAHHISLYNPAHNGSSAAAQPITECARPGVGP